jgi:hypothetical protein
MKLPPAALHMLHWDTEEGLVASASLYGSFLMNAMRTFNQV